jgi:hypothetical protein
MLIMTTTAISDTPTWTADQVIRQRAKNYARYVSCLIANRYSSLVVQPLAAKELYLQRWPRSFEIDLMHKAVVNPGVTTEPSYAAPLVTPRSWGQAFVSLERDVSVVGRLPFARRAPLGTVVSAQVTGGTFAFTGQGGPVPVGNQSLGLPLAPPDQSEWDSALSAELAKLSVPGAEDIIVNDLVTGSANAQDSVFTDPTNAGVSNERPASILNTADSFGSAGPTAANCATDLKRISKDFFAQNPGAVAPTFLMSPATAAACIAATGETRLDVVRGGTLLGIPTLTSAGVGNRLALIDAAAVPSGMMAMSTFRCRALQPLS